MENEVLVVSSLAPKGPGTLHEALLKCCSSDIKQRAIYFDVSGVIQFPEDSHTTDPADWQGCRIKGPKNVVVCGDSSPGRIVISGHPYLIEDPQNFVWRGMSHVLEAPVNKINASSWGPMRCTVSPNQTSRNVSFIDCSFVGGEDENAFGPNDWVERARDPFDAHYICPVFENLNFVRCFFGYGTSVHRNGYHNFGLMVVCVEKSSIVGCYFAHENRRSPQGEGFDNVAIGNVVYNYGTMAFGCLKGRWNVLNNLFVPGPNSRQSAPQVLPVQVTPSSGPVMRTGNTTFNLIGNRRPPLGAIPHFTMNDASFCDNQMSATGMTMTILSNPAGLERLLARYPDCYSAIDQLSRVGARGCPYVAKAVVDIKINELRPPYVVGATRGGAWIPAITGRLSDLGCPVPSSHTYLTPKLPTYDQLVAGSIQ